MRITYRYKNNKLYWTDRWDSIEADDQMQNDNVYPLKYAKKLIKKKSSLILEAGCGNGRILRYYHDLKYKIIGIDFIKVAIEKLKKVDKSLKVQVADIRRLEFKNNYFDYILAFGLYHNFMGKELDTAIKQTYRVLKNKGQVCASFRADNLQTLFTDYLARVKSKSSNKKKFFHKLNLSKKEFIRLFEKNNFKVIKVYPVENMPIIYKFKIFRHKTHQIFNENIARKEGYKLSILGNFFQKILIGFFPSQFCNVFVIIAEK